MSNSTLEKLFQFLAVVLIGIAAIFFWNRNDDGAFVSAVLGCVSFFLSIRFQVKERVEQRDAEILRNQQAEELESGMDPEAAIPDQIVSSETEEELRD